MSSDQTILLILLAYFAIGAMVVSFIDAAFELGWHRSIIVRVLAVATWPLVMFVTIGQVAGVWFRNRRER